MAIFISSVFSIFPYLSSVYGQSDEEVYILQSVTFGLLAGIANPLYRTAILTFVAFYGVI